MNAVEQVSESLPAGDVEELATRAAECAPDQPISIYEVHLPSWMRVPEEDNRALSFFEIAPKLAEHVSRMNFSHVQFLAPGYTEPAGLRFLVEHLHKQEIGVILDADRPLETPAGFPDIPVDGQRIQGETRLFSFQYRWDLRWAEDSVAYFATDPLYRKFRHGQFRHRDDYVFDCNQILPLSDQLVTLPRQSLLAIMPGDEWQKFANLRLLFAYQYLLPGKKLMFMGDEFGQRNRWQPETSLDWHLTRETGFHTKLMRWVGNLNRFYRDERALHQTDCDRSGFQWIDTSDAGTSVISFLRKNADASEVLLAVLNFTPVPRHNYRVGVPEGGFWAEVLNSDAEEFGGSGQGNLGGTEAAPFGWHFQSHSLILTLPPLGAIVLKARSGTGLQAAQETVQRGAEIRTAG
jgi:1,4-alpha-glucan branching enzyme